MSPLMTAAIIAGASGAGANLISRRMGLSRRWRRTFTVLCAVLPPAGYLLLGGTAGVRSVARAVTHRRGSSKYNSRELDDVLRKMSPKERKIYLRREGMKEMQSDLARSEARRDAAMMRTLARKEWLLSRPGWDETNLLGDRRYRALLARQGKAQTAFAADRRTLQEYMMSTSVRQADDRQAFISIRCNHLADGTLTFELPYDAGAETLHDIRIALSHDWGVAVNDYFRAQVTEHSSGDFRSIGFDPVRPGVGTDVANHSVFIYDCRKGTVSPAGEPLSPDTIKRVHQAMDEFREKIRSQAGPGCGLLDRDVLKGSLTLHTVGLDTVALAFNGIAVAYATAGKDGGIHLTGDDVPVGDRKTLRMASSLNEKLKGCANFGQWVDRAVGLLLSAENVGLAVKAVKRRQEARQIKVGPKKVLKKASEMMRRK